MKYMVNDSHMNFCTLKLLRNSIEIITLKLFLIKCSHIVMIFRNDSVVYLSCEVWTGNSLLLHVFANGIPIRLNTDITNFSRLIAILKWANCHMILTLKLVNLHNIYETQKNTNLTKHISILSMKYMHVSTGNIIQVFVVHQTPLDSLTGLKSDLLVLIHYYLFIDFV